MPGFRLEECRPSRRGRLRSISRSTHYVNFAQAILYRGASFDIVWRSFALVVGIGLVFFTVALIRCRRAVAVS